MRLRTRRPESRRIFVWTPRSGVPLLNDCNLCEVLLHLGEDKMAQICTDHPRYYEWFSDGREDGLGLCCEAAAELILAQTGAPAFDVTEADGVSETGTEAETELENVLFSMRDALFRLACEDAPFDDKADRLYRTAKAQQEQYDDLLFPFPEDEDADETDEDTASWSQAFWRESTLTSLLELLLGFEINKDDWRTLLTGAKARLPEIIARREAFLAGVSGKRHEYDNLLTYFMYRHFMKALGDDAVQDKVQLALVSTAVIQLLDVYGVGSPRARSRTGRRSASARRTRARLSITRTILSACRLFRP